MKRGLAVIVILCLTLLASSCVPSDIVVLDPSDHARIMAGVVDNSDEIITILTTPTVEQLLNAAREVEDISSATKTKIQYVLDLLPGLDGWLAEIPDETWQALDEIMGNVTDLETVALTRSFLQDAIDSGEYDDYEWLPEALEFGIGMLDAGENTIYNSGWAPYDDPPLIGFNVSQLWKEDLEGGIAGAVGCALDDAVPDQYAVGIGGVVGAVDSSIADLIDQLSSWW